MDMRRRSYVILLGIAATVTPVQGVPAGESSTPRAHPSSPNSAPMAHATSVQQAQKPAQTRGESPAQRRRRLTKEEVTSTLFLRSRQLLWDYRTSPVGTEIPIECNIGRCVAKIEVHYRPQREGNGSLATGYHRGISLFLIEAP